MQLQLAQNTTVKILGKRSGMLLQMVEICDPFPLQQSLKVASELLGHEDIATTGNTYTHIHPKLRAGAANEMIVS